MGKSTCWALPVIPGSVKHLRLLFPMQNGLHVEISMIQCQLGVQGIPIIAPLVFQAPPWLHLEIISWFFFLPGIFAMLSLLSSAFLIPSVARLLPKHRQEALLSL